MLRGPAFFENPEPGGSPNFGGPTTGTISAETLIKIAPATVTFPRNVPDAATAAPSINKSFERWGIKSVGEQAAAIAIMLFESGNFKYNKNHFPGISGQGTRNMQSPSFNKQYAATIGVMDPMADDDSSFGSAAWLISTQCSG